MRMGCHRWRRRHADPCGLVLRDGEHVAHVVPQAEGLVDQLDVQVHAPVVPRRGDGAEEAHARQVALEVVEEPDDEGRVHARVAVAVREVHRLRLPAAVAIRAEPAPQRPAGQPRGVPAGRIGAVSAADRARGAA
jgi:hypothetical protein